METIAGYLRTGRTSLGPGADLIELVGDDGFRHTAIVFHPECRDHPAMSALEVVKGYLEAPYVSGLLELAAHEADTGAFVYPTGEAWSVAEVVRMLGDLGHTGGIRAGLELMFAAGQVLVEAAEAGESHGVFCHGGLTPWRLMLKADGQVEILGYALPQVEILRFHADPSEVPPEDSFRYCPPERMEGQSEDLTADLFGLALIAFELMTGKPVYDGLVNEIRTQASRAEGSRRLFRYKDKLPRSVRDLLAVCLRARPEDRHPDGQGFLDAVSHVLSGKDASGVSLMDLMAEVGEYGRRAGEALETGKTLGMSRDELARMLSETTAPAVTVEEKKEVEDRTEASKPWSKSTRRGGRRKPEPPPSEAPASEAPASEAPASEPLTDPPTEPPEQPDIPVEETLPSDDVERPDPPPLDDEQSKPWARSSRRRPRRAQVSDAADAIIARITSSQDAEPSEAVAEPVGDRTAADVIEAILQSSTSNDRPNTEPSIPRIGDDDSASAPRARPKPKPKAKPKPRRVTRRRRESAALPIETLEPVSAVSYEESGAWRSAQEDPEPSFSCLGPPSDSFGEEISPETLPAFNTAPEPLPDRDEKMDLEAIEESEADTGPLVRLDPEDSEPVLESISTSPVEEPTEQHEPPTPPALRTPASLVSRPPDSLPALSGGKGRAYRIKRGPKGRTIKTRIPERMTLSEAVAFLVGTAVPIRTDLQGKVREGYRLGPESGPAPGDTPLKRFPEDSVLVLHPVPAREVWVDLEVRQGKPATRFRVPMNVALPVSSVVDAVAAWLDLPAGRWKLFLGDRPIGAHILLEELDLEGAHIILRR